MLFHYHFPSPYIDISLYRFAPTGSLPRWKWKWPTSACPGTSTNATTTAATTRRRSCRSSGWRPRAWKREPIPPRQTWWVLFWGWTEEEEGVDIGKIIYCTRLLWVLSVVKQSVKQEIYIVICIIINCNIHSYCSFCKSIYFNGRFYWRTYETACYFRSL